MTAAGFSSPLAALDAVVLDTETTGLDARKARIVQIGALRLAGGMVETGVTFERMLNPGIKIPPASSEIHGIRDHDVANAPGFAAIADELAAFIGDRIVVGHTIGYDLMMLQRESEICGKDWRMPRALDVRILAELALPTLAQFDLDRLAAMLGVEVSGRHTAMGDAEATAAVYSALVPHLRQRGIRTLAEAESASRSLIDRLAGASQPVAAVPGHSFETVPQLSRIDSFPYRHRVGDVMSSPPVWCDAATPVKQVVRVLIERKVSSVLVTRTDGVAGLATERDVLRAIDRAMDGGLDARIGDFASGPIHAIEHEAFVYRAIGRMDRLGIRHLGVTGPDGSIVGMVTTRNLLRHRATTALVLGDEIESAATSADLAKAWSRLPLMARTLLADDLDPRTLAAVISNEICAITRRAAEIGERRLLEAGQGPPPVPYAVLVLGSAARGESLLAADQDNAIVYETGEPGGVTDQWFGALGGHIADILDEAGIPYCKGGVMARNAAWRHSAAGWRSLIEGWVRRQRPEDLLNVDIFFDGRVVHGDAALGEAVLDHAFATAAKAPDFQKQISELARQWRSPVTMFGGLRTDDTGRIDLKIGALFPIVSAARALSIKHTIRSRATPDRYSAVIERGIGSPTDGSALIEAHRVIVGRILEQQLVDGEAGIPLSTRVDVKRLTSSQRADLKHAVGKVAIAIDFVSEGRI
jgi:CBS domain-containing protein